VLLAYHVLYLLPSGRLHLTARFQWANATSSLRSQVLTEKTAQDAAMRDMYHSWKRSPPRCVSPAEVRACCMHDIVALVFV
jgi:hypothetical protein